MAVKDTERRVVASVVPNVGIHGGEFLLGQDVQQLGGPRLDIIKGLGEAAKGDGGADNAGVTGL